MDYPTAPPVVLFSTEVSMSIVLNYRTRTRRPAALHYLSRLETRLMLERLAWHALLDGNFKVYHDAMTAFRAA